MNFKEYLLKEGISSDIEDFYMMVFNDLRASHWVLSYDMMQSSKSAKYLIKNPSFCAKLIKLMKLNKTFETEILDNNRVPVKVICAFVYALDLMAKKDIIVIGGTKYRKGLLNAFRDFIDEFTKERLENVESSDIDYAFRHFGRTMHDGVTFTRVQVCTGLDGMTYIL